MTVLYLIWLIFSAVFFYFGWASWRQAQEEIRPFHVRAREGEEGEVVNEPALPDDFNQYLEKINRENRSRYRIATIMYFIAGGVSLFSLILISFIPG